MDVKIPLTERQFTEALKLYTVRTQADHDFVLYTAAVIGGTEYSGGTCIGMQPATPTDPACLLLRVPDPPGEVPVESPS